MVGHRPVVVPYSHIRVVKDATTAPAGKYSLYLFSLVFGFEVVELGV